MGKRAIAIDLTDERTRRTGGAWLRGEKSAGSGRAGVGSFCWRPKAWRTRRSHAPRRMPDTVGKWRRRFAERVWRASWTSRRPARRVEIGDDEVAQIVRLAQSTPPGRELDLRSIAGADLADIRRVTHLALPAAHRSRAASCPSRSRVRRQGGGDRRLLPVAAGTPCPLCRRKSRDPGARASPTLSRVPRGHHDGAAHDYKRHGTDNLFAALEIATGQITGSHYNRRRRVEFLDFMNLGDVRDSRRSSTST